MNTYAVNARIHAEILTTVYKLTNIIPAWNAHASWLFRRQVGSSEPRCWYTFHAGQYTEPEDRCESALPQGSSQALG